ncbi:MAG: microcin C ABC transporter permease YejB [Rhodospirillales bacterium]
MASYIIRRLLLLIPTLLGIITINFLVVQLAPGGPVEQILSEVRGKGGDATSRFSGSGSDTGQQARQPTTSVEASTYRGARGLPKEFIDQLQKQFGFDKPLHERYFQMLSNYIRFDFGTSYFRDTSVIGLLFEKLPVSLSIGLWTTLIVYLVAIPLGIRKATRDGSRFDIATSGMVIAMDAIPSFLFALLLIVLFAGGSYFNIFPLRGLVSEGWSQLSLLGKIVDYLWHMVLPIGAMVISGFAALTLLTKNSFLDEISKQYVITARAKGLPERRVLYGHVFRNAMLLVIAGFPGAFVSILFGSSLLIEIIFSLDGLGLLGFESAIKRDYPVMFGTLYLFTLLGLLMNLITDLTYTLIDPRIDFEGRNR